MCGVTCILSLNKGANAHIWLIPVCLLSSQQFCFFNFFMKFIVVQSHKSSIKMCKWVGTKTMSGLLLLRYQLGML